MCTPFFASQNVKIMTVCLYFFVPTMALMYCYGSVFHTDNTSADGGKPDPQQIEGKVDQHVLYTNVGILEEYY